MKRILGITIINIAFFAHAQCCDFMQKPMSNSVFCGLSLGIQDKNWFGGEMTPEILARSHISQDNFRQPFPENPGYKDNTAGYNFLQNDFKKLYPDTPRHENSSGPIGIMGAFLWSLLSGKRNKHNEYDPRNVLHNHAQCARWSVGDFKDAMNSLIIGNTPPEQIRYPRGQFANDYIFEDWQYETVMSQWCLYKYNNFWEFIRKFPRYEMHLERIYRKIQTSPSIHEHLCPRIEAKICQEYQRIQREPRFICYPVAEPIEKQKQKQKQEQEQRHAAIRKTFSA